MRSVLRALPNRAALLLVGDVDQLPSVGPPRGRGPPEQFAADSPLEGAGFETSIPLARSVGLSRKDAAKRGRPKWPRTAAPS